MVIAGNVFVLDNGAHSAKAGFSSSDEPKIIPNCIMKARSERRRPFIGDQIEECRDASGLFYILPFQKGYLVNWDVQKNVWDYIFSNDCLPANFPETPVIVTEPYYNFNSLQEAMTEIFFEEYECHSLLRINAGDLCSYHYSKDNPSSLCCLLVDSGYSFTHIVPYIRGKKFRSGIRRIDIGGKMLTNHLKDIISYRQLHVMDETYVMNQVKEDTCFVSLDFNRDIEIARKRGTGNTIVRDYVLPDYTSIRRGYVKDPQKAGGDQADQQCLRLNNERFTVPEVLFHPSDIGVGQMGVPEAIVDCILACPPETHAHLYRNILLVGGTALFSGFRERVYKEIRAIAPSEFEVRVSPLKDPITYAWYGGRHLARDPELKSRLVRREEYEEEGFNACIDRFDV